MGIRYRDYGGYQCHYGGHQSLWCALVWWASATGGHQSLVGMSLCVHQSN